MATVSSGNQPPQLMSLPSSSTMPQLAPECTHSDSDSPPPILEREDPIPTFPTIFDNRYAPVVPRNPAYNVKPKFQKHKEYKSSGSCEVKIFHPTMDDMKNFSNYIVKIEREHGAHLACGICKIVPPLEWHPKLSRQYTFKEIEGFDIQSPVRERIEQRKGLPGVYLKTNKVYKKFMSGKEFREMANSKRFRTPNKATIEELEDHYWRNTIYGEPVYGADTPGTLYDDEVTDFNITKLGSILDLLNTEKIQIKGVNTPFLYYGMYKTTFPWHAEDMDLYSINYVHVGEPKFWYGIPPESADRFEKLAAQLFPEGASACKGFLRHKTYMVSPDYLREQGIPYGTMVQYPGEFMITFPRGYHMGFNAGFNIAEATNFAMPRWIDYGKNVVLCSCSGDRVEIDMCPFMKIYRPDEYDTWYQYWYVKRPSCTKTEIKKKLTRQRLLQLFPGLSYAECQAMVVSTHHYNKAVDRMDRLQNLFQYIPCFYTEQQFNRSRARIFPHCAVCQYLTPDLGLVSDLNMPYQMPHRSRRYVTNQMFYKNPNVANCSSDPREDEIIECSNCHVVVHRHCYTDVPSDDGQATVSYYRPESPTSWICFRCVERSPEKIETTVCQFCHMRGGALIPSCRSGYFKNEFSHVICALTHRRTKVVADSAAGHPISISVMPKKALPWRDTPEAVYNKINPYKISFDPMYLAVRSTYDGSSKSLQCELCGFNNEGLLACILCDDGFPRYFHATCARLLDIVFEQRNYPNLLVPVCTIHNIERPDYFVDETEVVVGDQVTVLRCNGEPCNREATVLSIDSKDLFTVDFFDGSMSEDIEAQDIVQCECNEMLCDKVNHIYGSLMSITWLDAQLWQGYYRGRRRTCSYTVQFNAIQETPETEVQKVAEPEKPITCERADLVKKIIPVVAKRGRKRKSN